MLIYPLGGILIVGAMMCAVNPVMGMINTAMTDWLNALGGSSKVLLGAIVAGMMSVDMGGPVNKEMCIRDRSSPMWRSPCRKAHCGLPPCPTPWRARASGRLPVSTPLTWA